MSCRAKHHARSQMFTLTFSWGEARPSENNS